MNGGKECDKRERMADKGERVLYLIFSVSQRDICALSP
jgi:hypothetical protein